MRKRLFADFLLLIAAFIWGSAFVAQSIGMDYVGPFTYLAARSYLGTLVLIPVILIFARPLKPSRDTVIGGILCGIILFAASSFQQFGIMKTTAGKAGFITALYIIFVPLIGIFMKKKPSLIKWFCAFMAVAGFYFLCIGDDFCISSGDLTVLICAVFFSFHIIVIEMFIRKKVNGIIMSAIQFAVVAVLSTIFAGLFEVVDYGNILSAWKPICYAGILSSGVAYTLQILGQKHADSVSATLIMSLESVFAALSGWIILHESFSVREFFGCFLVIAAVIISQLPYPKELQ